MLLDPWYWNRINETLDARTVRKLYHFARQEQVDGHRALVRRARCSPHQGIRRAAEALARPDSAEIRDARERILQSGFFVITYEDERFPERLRRIPDPPCLLYVEGDLSLLSEPSVGVVGARRVSAYGRRMADWFAGELSVLGFRIVSGAARGVDTCAHTGALRAGGKTVAVLGSGFWNPYPPENRALFSRIREQGALVSEYHPKCRPLRMHFPERNRLISGLSDRLLVVEAARNSGSLITAGCALEQGKDVYAVPQDVDRAGSEGTNRLLFDGAIPALSPQDFALQGKEIHAEKDAGHSGVTSQSQND